MNKNPKSIEDRLVAMIRGITKVLPQGQTTPVRGVVYDASSLAAKLETLAAPYRAADVTQAAFTQAVLDRDGAEKATLDFYHDVEASLRGSVGASNQVLREVGLKPSEPRQPLTLEQKVQKAARAKETRLLRHTLGPKQKEKLKAATQPEVSPDAKGNGAVAPPAGGASHIA